MGRLVSVRLQLSTAEVWLMTSAGSVMMFGASDRKQREETNYLPFIFAISDVKDYFNTISVLNILFFLIYI